MNLISPVKKHPADSDPLSTERALPLCGGRLLGVAHFGVAKQCGFVKESKSLAYVLTK